MPNDASEIAMLRAEVAALEQLLEIQEHTVTEQTARLEVKAAELRRSNYALEQFAYVISHDLQEPLRMVAAYTELLREAYEGKLDANADKYIGFASGGARRMQELINALLDFSRITTRGEELETVALERVVDDALENLGVAIAESHAEISREPLPSVRGDRIQLVRLVQNLVGNAIKFSESDQKPRIRIRAAIRDQEVSLAIADSGIGIDPRHHARIFEIFRRIHPKRFAGTGMGLAICQRIAERHGGSIRVESSVAKGAVFVVTLKLEKEGS